MLPLWSRGLGVLFWGGRGAEGGVVEGGKLRGYWRDEQLEVYFGFWGVLGVACTEDWMFAVLSVLMKVLISFRRVTSEKTL